MRAWRSGVVEVGNRLDSLTALVAVERPWSSRSHLREESLAVLPGKADFTGSVSRRRAWACHQPVRPCDATKIHEEHEEIGRGIDGAARPVPCMVRLSQSAVIG